MIDRPSLIRHTLDTAIDCPPGEVHTLQEDFESTKIGTIMRQYRVSGLLPQQAARAVIPPELMCGGMDYTDHTNLLTEVVNNGKSNENCGADSKAPLGASADVPAQEVVKKDVAKNDVAPAGGEKA